MGLASLEVGGFFPGPSMSLWLPCGWLSIAEPITVTVTAYNGLGVLPRQCMSSAQDVVERAGPPFTVCVSAVLYGVGVVVAIAEYQLWTLYVSH